MRYNLLFVDSKIDNLEFLKGLFKKKYNIFIASTTFEAIEIIKNYNINMVICDHGVQDSEGGDLLKKIIDMSPDTIRILLTESSDAKKLINAINIGKISRYVRKPINPEELDKIISSSLEVYQLNIDNQELVRDLKEMFSGTITAITEALDAKDSFTFGRSKRVTYYSLITGKELNLSDSELSELELAGLLHNIGMIGINETILNKVESLTIEEYETIKKHVDLGVKILEEIKQLEPVVKIIAYHHERYDGKGYPFGLEEKNFDWGKDHFCC